MTITLIELLRYLVGFICGYYAHSRKKGWVDVPKTHLKYLLMMHKQYERFMLELINSIETKDNHKLHKLYHICKKVVQDDVRNG